MGTIELFKYASMGSAIKIIKNSSVMLNSPNNFNDPFDSFIGIREDEKQKVLELTINYFIFKIFCDFVKRTDLQLKLSQKVLFKTLKLEIAAYIKILKKNKTYSILPFLNDMVDKFSMINPELKIAIEDAKDKLVNEIIPSLEKMRSKARISCFSTKKDSILMWSHYADSHRGVCFEFEENREYFKKVNYSTKKPFLNLSGAIARLLAYDFIGEKITYQDKEFANIMLDSLFTKSMEWSYENEVRCVLSDEEINTLGYYYEGEKSFLKMKISKIYIGTKASGANLKELLYLADNRKIPVVFMKEDENNYSIVPDCNKKIIGEHKGIVYKNSLESMLDELKDCLNNDLYLGAMQCALTIPRILGSILYPEMNYKNAYIKWYQDNIGKHESFCTPGMPYLNGEACLKLKESLHNFGNTNGVIQDYGSFKIDEFKLIIEDKNYFDIYGGEASTGGDFNHKKTELQINIRDFCFKISRLANVEITNNPIIIDKISKMNLRFFSREIEELEEDYIKYKK